MPEPEDGSAEGEEGRASRNAVVDDQLALNDRCQPNVWSQREPYDFSPDNARFDPATNLSNHKACSFSLLRKKERSTVASWAPLLPPLH